MPPTPDDFSEFAHHTPYLPACCQSWRELLPLAERVVCRAGEQMVGHTGGEMVFYYVESGSCQTSLNMLDGSIENIFIMGAGTLAGLPMTLGGSILPASSLVCRRGGVFWRFRQSLWTERFVSEYPQQVMECSRMLAICTMSMVNLRMVSRSGTERGLARFLCGMVHDQRTFLLRPVFSITQMAQLLGVHRVSLSRLISGLVERGVLGRYDRDVIEILDPAGLLDLAQGETRFRRR